MSVCMCMCVILFLVPVHNWNIMKMDVVLRWFLYMVVCLFLCWHVHVLTCVCVCVCVCVLGGGGLHSVCVCVYVCMCVCVCLSLCVCVCVWLHVECTGVLCAVWYARFLFSISVLVRKFVKKILIIISYSLVQDVCQFAFCHLSLFVSALGICWCICSMKKRNLLGCTAHKLTKQCKSQTHMCTGMFMQAHKQHIHMFVSENFMCQ